VKRRFFLHSTLVGVAGVCLPARLRAADAPAAAPATTPAPTPAAPPTTPAAPSTMEAAVTRLYQLGRRNVAIHDPSAIIKCKDEYWVFYTGNRSYHSKDLLNWTSGPAVLTAPFPWFADAVPGFRGTSYWAPDCIKVGDKYFLFYSISAFGKNTSAIGLVTSPTLDPADPAYAWTDQGMVIKSVATDPFNCIDPCAILTPDGKLWLSFGSFWSGIKLIALDPTGHRIPDSPMYSIAANPGHATATNEGRREDRINSSQIEASYLYYHDKYYYLFVNWGLCCHGISSTYNIRVGRSEKITGPYLDKDGKDLAHDGGTLLLGTEGPILANVRAAPDGRGGYPPPPAEVHAFVGPGQSGIFEENGKFWFTCHYYDGTVNGASILSIRPLTWDKSGWPVVGEYPAPAPVPTVRFLQGGRRGRRGGGGGGGGNTTPPPAPVQPAPAAPAPTPAASTPAPAPATATAAPPASAPAN